MNSFFVRLSAKTLLALAALTATRAWADDDPIRPFLPAETQVVLVINVRPLLDSPLVKKNAPGLKESSFSPVNSRAIKQVRQVTAAYPGVGPADRATVLLRGKIDPEAFEAEMKDGAAAGRVKAIESPSGRYYQRARPDRLIPGAAAREKMYFAVLDDQTMVFSFGDDGPVKDALEVKSGVKKPADNQAVNGLLDRLDPKDALGLVMCGAFKGRLPEGLVPEGLAAVYALFAQAFQGDAAPPYDNLVAALRLEGDAKARATATAKDADAAHDLARQARDGLKQLRDACAVLALTSTEAKAVLELLKGTKVEEANSEVTVSATMPAGPAGLLIKLASKVGK